MQSLIFVKIDIKGNKLVILKKMCWEFMTNFIHECWVYVSIGTRNCSTEFVKAEISESDIILTC